MWWELMWIAAGGALGALLRFGLSGAVQQIADRTSWTAELPLGTWAVNMLGCMLFGVIWALAEERLVISGETRFWLLTGFVGSLTTFSTFAFETGELLRDSEWLLAAGNVLAHNGVGLVCVFVGIAIGRLF